MITVKEYTPPPSDLLFQKSVEPTAPGEPSVYRLAGLVDALIRDAEARHTAKTTNQSLGVVTGFSDLDAALGGAFAPGLHCLHAEPGVGKTAFALQLAALCGSPCLFVTCEVAPLELLRRHTARVTGTFLSKFKSGELSPALVQTLALRAVEEVPFLVLVDATTKAATIPFLLRESEIHRGNAPHFLLVIDSLHAWARRTTPPGLPEYEALNAALAGLGELAAQLSCPLLYIAERNRGAMRQGGQSAGAGTRVIEYGAETVMELSRTSDREDNDGWVEVVMTLSKNRHGATGKEIPLRWRGSTQTFEMDFTN